MTGPTVPTPPFVWLNGRITPVDRAAISPFDRGFLYGDGLFETLRAEKGHLLYLGDHLERLRRSCADLRIHADLPQDLELLLRELLIRNNLMGGAASVKIVVSRGTCVGFGLPGASRPTVCMTAQEYHPPAPSAYRLGWRLHVFRSGFSPPLACHKTLNYLYFLMARQAALDEGDNEAVILDPQGRVCETSAGSILAKTDGTWWTPAGDHRLPSITLKQVSGILAEEGSEVEHRSAAVPDLLSAQTVWVLSSLMGIMPASHVDGHAVPDMAAEDADRLRRRFIERGIASGAI